MAEILPRKTIVEIRFRSRLDYFRLLDEIGSELLEELGLTDWARSDDSVFVIDRAKRERFGLEYRRFFFESDSSDDDSRLTAPTRGWKTISRALQRLKNVKLQRVGVRQFFAIRIGRLTQQQLMTLLLRRYKSFSDFAEASAMSVKDLSFTADLLNSSDPRMQGKLVIGSMDRSEWTTFVPSRADQTTYLTKDMVADIVNQLPTSFLFIDIDKAMAIKKADEMLELQTVADFISSVERDCKRLAAKAIEDLT